MNPPAPGTPADHGRRIAVIGLGYVGLPVTVAFAAHAPVQGFDIDPERILELRRGLDRKAMFDSEQLSSANLHFTHEAGDLDGADFFIVTVPTPVDEANHPDLSALEAASRTVGGALRPGGVVVYESTVYPGVTEEICIPLLEAASGLRAGTDFSFGYAPERINPGDEAHTLQNVVKIISAHDEATLDIMARVYGSVVKAELYRAPSIQVAEAAKVIENVQRDLNIALVNELAMIFNRLGLDSGDVLAAAGTKWNFLPFRPGLVGGHCIGIDPYYLTHRATAKGQYPEVILAGRRINDEMGAFVAENVAQLLATDGGLEKGCRVTVLGAAFKENVPDVRNSGVRRIVAEFARYGIEVQVFDPLVDPEAVRAEIGIMPAPALEALAPARAVVIAVAHEAWGASPWRLVTSLLEEERGVVADIPRVLDRDATPPGVRLWRL